MHLVAGGSVTLIRFISIFFNNITTHTTNNIQSEHDKFQSKIDCHSSFWNLLFFLVQYNNCNNYFRLLDIKKNNMKEIILFLYFLNVRFFIIKIHSYMQCRSHAKRSKIGSKITHHLLFVNLVLSHYIFRDS